MFSSFSSTSKCTRACFPHRFLKLCSYIHVFFFTLTREMALVTRSLFARRQRQHCFQLDGAPVPGRKPPKRGGGVVFRGGESSLAEREMMFSIVFTPLGQKDENKNIRWLEAESGGRQCIVGSVCRPLSLRSVRRAPLPLLLSPTSREKQPVQELSSPLLSRGW